jgi:hypothetical protein
VENLGLFRLLRRYRGLDLERARTCGLRRSGHIVVRLPWGGRRRTSLSIRDPNLLLIIGTRDNSIVLCIDGGRSIIAGGFFASAIFPFPPDSPFVCSR